MRALDSGRAVAEGVQKREPANLRRSASEESADESGPLLRESGIDGRPCGPRFVGANDFADRAGEVETFPKSLRERLEDSLRDPAAFGKGLRAADAEEDDSVREPVRNVVRSEARDELRVRYVREERAVRLRCFLAEMLRGRLEVARRVPKLTEDGGDRAPVAAGDLEESSELRLEENQALIRFAEVLPFRVADCVDDGLAALEPAYHAAEDGCAGLMEDGLYFGLRASLPSDRGRSRVSDEEAAAVSGRADHDARNPADLCAEVDESVTEERDRVGLSVRRDGADDVSEDPGESRFVRRLRPFRLLGNREPFARLGRVAEDPDVPAPGPGRESEGRREPFRELPRVRLSAREGLREDGDESRPSGRLSAALDALPGRGDGGLPVGIVAGRHPNRPREALRSLRRPFGPEEHAGKREEEIVPVRRPVPLREIPKEE